MVGSLRRAGGGLRRLAAGAVLLGGAAVLLAPGVARAQEGATITGRVVNDAGAPIPAVNVSITTLDIGTVSRPDGGYTVVVPASRTNGQRAQLVARLAGFRTVSVPIVLRPGTIFHDFTLTSSAVQQSRVAPVGAGLEMPVERVAAPRGVVDSTLIWRSGETNLLAALAAKVPNVDVVAQSADPAAPAFVRIRGIRSLTAVDHPLVVVDGTPMGNVTIGSVPLTPSSAPSDARFAGSGRTFDIHPNDVAAVEVLRGPAAAIYGVRGGQGVLLVTTKGGTPGRTQVQLRSGVSVDRVVGEVPLQRRFGQSGSGATLRAFGADIGGGGIDQFGELFGTGLRFDNSLVVAGGAGSGSFLVSGGFTAQGGPTSGASSGMMRGTLRAKAAQQLARGLTLRATGAFTTTSVDLVAQGANGLAGGALRLPPDVSRPAALGANAEATQSVAHLFGNVGFDWDAATWFRVSSTLGADRWSDERRLLETADELTYLELDHILTATVARELTTDVAASLTLGHNFNARDLERSGAGNVRAGDAAGERRLSGLFAQATVDVSRQLFLTGSVRSDGVSTDGASNGRLLSPRFGASWLFNNYIGDVGGYLSSAKLRLGAGSTGIEPPVGLAGEDGPLKPERQREIEVGADVGVLQDRVLVGLTVYDSRASDVVLLAGSAPGAPRAAVNGGEIRNRGVEFTLDFTPIQRARTRWDLGLQFARNANEALDLGGARFIDLPGGSVGAVTATAVRGQPVGVLRGTDFARCGRGIVIGSLDVDANCGGSFRTGALYLGANGLPILDTAASRVIADPTPDWTAAARSALRLGRFTVTALLDVRAGGERWNGTRGLLYSYGTHRDTESRGGTRTFGVDYSPGNRGSTTFPVAGPGANRPATLDSLYFAGAGGGERGAAAQFVEDAGFTKLRELGLQWTLDAGWVRGLGFGALDLRVTGRNLLVFSKAEGTDPETSPAGVAMGLRGIEYFNAPHTRSVVLSVTLNR